MVASPIYYELLKPPGPPRSSFPPGLSVTSPVRRWFSCACSGKIDRFAESPETTCSAKCRILLYLVINLTGYTYFLLLMQLIQDLIQRLNHLSLSSFETRIHNLSQIWIVIKYAPQSYITSREEG
jgi:hypothetical protein